MLVIMMIVRGAEENVTFIFQGREDQLSCARIGVSQSAVTLLATLAVCLTSKNLLLLVGAHVLGGFESAIYGFVLLRFKVRRNADSGPIFGEARSLLKQRNCLTGGGSPPWATSVVVVCCFRRLV